MTIAQMHISWRERYDRSGNLSSADFDPEQIDFWLNLAQEAFVKNRYLPLNKGFEQIEKRISDLEMLVEAQALNTTPGTFRRNSHIVDLTGLTYTHWFTTNEEVAYSYTDCNGTTVGTSESTYIRNGVTQCSEDTYPAMVENSFGDFILRGDYARPLRLRRQNQVEIITDGNYTIQRYYITYIRKPVAMDYANSVDCELKDHTHEEIVDLAVRMAAASVTDKERYQMQIAEQQQLGQ